MALDSRRSVWARRILAILFVGAILGGPLVAQPDAADPATLSARIVDNKLYGSERLEAARTLVAHPGGEWIRPAFDAVAVVVARYDALKQELKKLERRVAVAEEDGPILGMGRPTARHYTALRQKRDLENLRKDVNEEVMVLKAVCRGVRSRLLEPQADVAAVESIAQDAVKKREPGDRAGALRALGFFPTAAARAVVVEQVTAKPPVVAVAAMRALQELARGMAETPDANGCWLDAYARLRHGLTRSWKDRDAAHRAYRARSAKHVKYLHKVGLKASAQMKKALRGAKPKDLPESVVRKLDKLEAERKTAASTLRELEGKVEVCHDTLAVVFDRLSEADRAGVESPLVAGLRKLGHQAPSIRLVRLCGRLRSDDIHAALVAAAAAAAPEARLACCDALGRHGRAEGIPALAACLEDVFWQVRVAAIRALETIGGKATIDAFVEALADTDGLVQHRVNSALAALTGKDFHTNAVLWRAWWAEHRDGYDGPPRKKKKSGKPRLGDGPVGGRAAAGAGGDDEAGRVSFYGIRTRSKRIIFVLDVSGSMHGDMSGLDLIAALLGKRPKETERKINHAREQLRLALVSLPPDAVFNIVTYGDKVKAWKPDPMRATADNKEAAGKWVEKIEPDGQTNIFDAITRALGMIGRGKGGRLKPSAADTIYLLTDGHANRGAVIDPAEMLEEIDRINASRRVTIHAVALGVGADSAFMQRLAKRFRGRFVHLKGKAGQDD